MFDLQSYTKHTKFGQYDFLLTSYEELKDIQPIMLPKISGEWSIVMLNPSIADAKSILADESIPKFFNVVIYLQQNKLNTVLEEYPEYTHKNLTNFEVYKQFVSSLAHPISNEAMYYAYRAAGGDMNELESSLLKIDTALEGQTITMKDIQGEFSYTKRVYTSQILRDFVMRARWRFTHYDTWLNELGMQYAYNSLYKTVKTCVHEKSEYLKGKDVKNRYIDKLDGISLSVLYTLFVNSTHYSQLESILYEFDRRDNKHFRRYMNACI